jgi:hypothetical protein
MLELALDTTMLTSLQRRLEGRESTWSELKWLTGKQVDGYRVKDSGRHKFKGRGLLVWPRLMGLEVEGALLISVSKRDLNHQLIP